MGLRVLEPRVLSSLLQRIKFCESRFSAHYARTQGFTWLA